MAPMTRSRAIGNVPNALMATYYAQRAGAGLIITEGTAPCINALGYANIPGLYSKEQVAGWKLTTGLVHERGSKIFAQLMHTGRMGYLKNMPAGAEILGPSPITAGGRAVKNTQRSTDYHLPRAMNHLDIVQAKSEFVSAAINAIEAGFDGVELHGANEHLIEQFLSAGSNLRQDEYGGTAENRCRFALEVAASVGEAIGFERVGIRLSPYGANNDMEPLEMNHTYDFLTKGLNAMGIAYIHHVDHSAMGGNTVPDAMKQMVRNNFKGAVILTGGFDRTTAEEVLQAGLADLIGFGRPYIGNPDLAERMQRNLQLNQELDVSTFYSAGPEGYTDYPGFSK